MLRRKATKMPTGAGVYLFKDSAGRLLYVGKAKNLRSRVASYFQPAADLLTARGPDINRMVERLVADIDLLECDSEVEALLRENRLIKDTQPPFNARLKDGKSFPYLQITTREDFARVSITRAPRLRSAKLYGPFVSVKDLRAALPMMQRVFKFRTCNLDISDGDESRRQFRPCILHNIKQCTAPCAGRVSKADYRGQIARLRDFLESKGSKIRRELTAEMARAAEALAFERAAELRDQSRALDGLQKRGLVHEHEQPEVFYIDPAEGLARLAEVLGLAAAPRTIEGVDIAHLAGGEACGATVCFIDGRPLKSAYRRYKIKTVCGGDDPASIGEVLRRRYRLAGAGDEIFPDVILIDGGKPQLSAACDAFDRLQARPPTLLALAKRAEEIFTVGRSGPIRLPRRDTALRLLQSVRDEAHRFARHYHHILRRRATLQSDKPLRRRNFS